MHMSTISNLRFKVLVLALFCSVIISSQAFAGQVKGFIDGVTAQGSNIVVSGWACDGTSDIISVDVYTGTTDKAGNSIIKGNQANEERPDLKDACGSTAHGFSITLTSDMLNDQTKLMIWVGSSGVFLNNSGKFSIPENPA